MSGIEHLLADWGLAAIFLGAMAEGESIVLAGGAMAQRGLFTLSAVIAVAFTGTVAMDQLCFVLGRRFRDSPWVQRRRRGPVFGRAIGFIERFPNAYILAFRFLPGLRIISPIALGVSRVPARRFVVLNLIAAAVWAPMFAAIGYEAGHAVEGVFGRIRSGERYLLVLAAVVIGGGILFSAAHRLLPKRAK